jgi:uncharacterized GH25 family protein
MGYFLVLLLAGLCAINPARAHEFWISPSTFSPARGSAFELSLFVGEFYTGELVGVTASHAASVRLFSAAGEQDLSSRFPRGQMLPSLRLTVASSGTHLLAYDSHPSEVVLSADKFHAYLHDEGLDAIITQRQTAGTAAKEGRERFRRHAKVLMRVDGKTDGTFGTRTGQRLEIVPLADPLRAGAGDRLDWQITFDQKPLEGVLVKAWHKEGSQVSVVRARTDARGQVRLTLPFAGSWLLNSVHMIPGDSASVDWESHWSSLTFDLPARRR